MPTPEQEATIAAITRWAEEQPAVRAAVLTSTLAVPGACTDVFSDYDVILALSDVRPFTESRGWLSAFGAVLAMYRDPLDTQDGLRRAGAVVQFESGLKIDFSLWDAAILRQIAAGQLPPEFDAGYRILIDKDRLTEGLRPPTYRGYIPDPPTEARYNEWLESFFLVAVYIAKYLWRGDRVAAKFLLDGEMKHENLLPMLECLIQLDHGWTARLGPYGRRIQRYLRPDLWDELLATYAGPGEEENWQALHRTIALMHKAAVEVGERLDFAYPHDMERKTVAHLDKIKAQPH